jgi:hypothetical protein
MIHAFVLPDKLPGVFWVDPKQAIPGNRPLFLDNGKGERIPIGWEWDEPRKGLIVPSLRLPKGKWEGWKVDYRLWLAPVFDVSNRNAATSGAVTTSITPANGMNAICIACIHLTSSASLSSITFDGVAMTAIGSVGSTLVTFMYYKLNPPTVSKNVIATPSTGPCALHVSNYAGVNQTTPLGTVQTTAGISASAGITLTTVVTDLMIDTVSGQNIVTHAAGQTDRVHQNETSIGDCAESDKLAGSPTDTMNWTQASSYISLVGVPLHTALQGGQPVSVSPIYMI